MWSSPSLWEEGGERGGQEKGKWWPNKPRDHQWWPLKPITEGLIIDLVNSSFIERKASIGISKTLVNERRGSGVLGMEEPHRARPDLRGWKSKAVKRTGSARLSPWPSHVPESKARNSRALWPLNGNTRADAAWAAHGRSPFRTREGKITRGNQVSLPLKCSRRCHVVA